MSVPSYNVKKHPDDDENKDSNRVSNDDAKSNNKPNDCSVNDSIAYIKIGNVVEVSRRMWPGIFRPGGAARVTFIHYDDRNQKNNDEMIPTHINVVYIIEGGSESRVPIEYVKEAPQYNFNVSSQIDTFTVESNNSNLEANKHTKRTLRNRSLLLGRCKRCGSLRMDCGSCDVWENSNATIRKTANKQNSSASEVKIKEKKMQKQANRHLKLMHSSYISASSSSEDTDELIDKIQASHRQYRRSKYLEKKKMRSILLKSNLFSTERGSTSKSKSSQDTQQKRLRRVSSSTSFSSMSSSSESALSSIKINQNAKNLKKGRKTFGDESDQSDVDAFVLSSLGVKKKKQTELKKKQLKSKSSKNVSDLDPLQTLEGIGNDEVVDSFHSTSSSSSSSSHDEISISTQPEPSKQHSLHQNLKENHSFDFETSDNEEHLDKPTKSHLKHSTKRKKKKGKRHQHVVSSSSITETTPSPSQLNYKEYFDPLDNPHDTFIQPEGDFAAENLPQGINDRTSSIPYNELPSFFDFMANIIENESLPNAEFKLEFMKHKLHNIQDECSQSLELELTKEDVDRRKEIHEKRYSTFETELNKLYEDLETQLIRDGLDQCRKSLKRIIDGYRAHKKIFFSANQKKEFRGIKMEKRDFRMEELETKVEKVLRNTRAFIESFFDLMVRRKQQDADKSFLERNSSQQFLANKDEISPQDDTPDVTSKHDLFEHEYTDNVSQPLDPHPYAKKVRNLKSSQNSVSVKNLTTNFDSIEKGRKIKKSRIGNSNKRNADTSKYTLKSSKKRSSSKSLQHTIKNNNEYHPFINSDEFFKKKSNIQTSATQNMLDFLNANAGNVEDDLESDQEYSNPEGNNERRSLRSKNFAPKTRLRINSSSRSDVRESSSASLSRTDLFPSMKELFNVLNEVEHDDTPLVIDLSLLHALPPAKSISEMCDTIIKNYPTNQKICSEYFHWIHNYFATSKSSPDGVVMKRYAKVIFEMILTMLQKHGRFTLLEAIYCFPSRLILHIKFLTFIVLMLGNKLNHYLTTTETLVNKIFKLNEKDFIDQIILQILDFLYSQILQKAWGEPQSVTLEVLHNVKSLSAAISSISPILETVSRLILTSLKCQHWRFQVHMENEIRFVSCVDPLSFRKFLMDESYESPMGQDSVRFKMFKTSIPRSEIEAVWSLLAYFGAFKSIAKEGGNRWRLIISLFLSVAGVLGEKSVSQDKTINSILPPNPTQIICCANEIRYFSKLLQSSYFNPLPTKDTLFEKLVVKSIGLNADFCRRRHNKYESFLSNCNEKRDLRVVRNLWDASDLKTAQMNMPIQEVENFSEVLVGSDTLYNEDQLQETIFCQSPSSRVVSSCLSLCIQWGYSCIKKARRIRYQRTLLEIVESFTIKAKYFEDKVFMEMSKDKNKSTITNTMDDFEKKIGPIIETESTGLLASACLYRESAAFLFLSTVVVESFSPNDLMPASQIDFKFCQKIWKILSRNTMVKIQRFYFDQDHHGQCQTDTLQYSGPLLLAACKIITLTLEKFLADQNMDNIKTINMENGVNVILKYLISCIGACLKCSCDLLKETEKTKSLSPLTYDFDNRQNSILYVRLMTRICCLFSKALNGIKVNLTSSCKLYSTLPSPDQFATFSLSLVMEISFECLSTLLKTSELGKTGDICFRSLLSLIRIGIDSYHCITNMKSKIKKSSVQYEPTNDPFGGIDDNIFLNIDIDSLITKQKARNEITPYKNQIEHTRNVPKNVSYKTTGDEYELNRNQINSDNSKYTNIGGDCNHSCSDNSKYTNIGGNVWKLLLHSMKMSNPSLRFSIPDTNQGHGINVRLCGRQVGGICSTLAAMCTLKHASSVKYFDTFESIFRPDTYIPMENDDRLHFNILGQYFGAQLCHLASSFQTCKDLVHENLNEVFGHFLEAIIDSNIIRRFPTSNLELIDKIGGNTFLCRQMLDKSLVTRINSKYSFSSPGDNDAVGITRQRKSFFDAPDYFMCKIIWKFCVDIGKLMEGYSSEDENDDVIKNIGKLLTNTELMENEEFNTFMAKVQASSLERECFKRFVKLKDIFYAFTAHRKKNRNLSSNIVEGNAIRIVKSLLEHIYYISSTVKYYDHISGGSNTVSKEANTNSLKRSNAYALQRAYTEMACASLSCFLRHYEFNKSKKLDQYMQFLKDAIISPVLLQDKNFDIHSAMEKAARPSNPLDLCFDIDIHTKRKNSKSELSESSLNIDLQRAFCSRMDDLTVHVACSEDEGLMYAALMEAGILAQRNKYDDFIANKIGNALSPLSFSFESSSIAKLMSLIRSDDLQNVVDVCLNVFDTRRYNFFLEQKSVQVLRSSALDKFFLPRLKSTKKTICSTTKIGILKVIMGILGYDCNGEKIGTTLLKMNFDSVKNLGRNKARTISLNDISSTFRSLIVCLWNEISLDEFENEIFEYCFKVAKILFTVSIEKCLFDTHHHLKGIESSQITMLEWINYGSAGYDQDCSFIEMHRQYLRASTKWMRMFGELTAGCNATTLSVVTNVLRQYNIDTFQDKINNNIHFIDNSNQTFTHEALKEFLGHSKIMLEMQFKLFPQQIRQHYVENKYGKQAYEKTVKTHSESQKECCKHASVNERELSSKAKLSIAQFLNKMNAAIKK